MSSLQAHLERHDVAASPLEFRRDCPLCHAERVQGHLPSASLVPPRARAAMAAALLAGTAMAPGAAVAADSQGVAAPAPAAPPPPQASDLAVGDGGAAPVGADQNTGPGSADAARDQGSDDGPPSERGAETDAGSDSLGPAAAGPSDSHPSTAPSDGATAGSDDGATLQHAPAEEPSSESAPPAPTGAPERSADAGPAAAPAPASDDGDAGARSESESDPGPGPPSRVSPVAPAGSATGATESADDSQQHHSSSERHPPPSASAPPRGDRHGAPHANRGSDRAGRTARDGRRRVADATATGSAAKRGHSRRQTEPSDAYRVRPGDSLWRIAERRLGSSASTTETAQEVTRLWELNRQRIGTGNPDLILPGQTLRM
jgi:hypothetical protein